MTPVGLLVVDKPAGMTSHDVVARVRRALGTRRVGHAGTLDPSATGVLVLGIGAATRLLQFLSGLDKEYEGVVRFGVTTASLDADGEVLDRRPMPGLTRADIEAVLDRFRGPIMQVPPMVSALKRGGVALHRLARQGEEVEREPRPVTVYELAVVDFAPGPYPEAAIRVRCSTGTYVRSLAADLGAALGGGAHLGALRRLSVGPFTVAEAVALDDVSAAHVRAPLDGLQGLPRVEVDDERARAVRHGAVFASLGPGPIDGPTAVTHGDELIAVYGPHHRGAKPIVVLASSGSPSSGSCSS